MSIVSQERAAPPPFRTHHVPVVSTIRHRPVTDTNHHVPVRDTNHHEPVTDTNHHVPVVSVFPDEPAAALKDPGSGA